MNLIPEWKKLAPKLWSVRLALLAAFLAAVEVGFTMWLTGKPPILSLAAGVFSLGAAVARIIAQPSLKDG